MGKDQEPCGVRAMFEWATMNGAKISKLGVRGTPGCNDYDTTYPPRTIYATMDIGDGDTILKIPEKLILSETVARESRIGRGITRMLEEDPEVLNVLGEHSKDLYVIPLLYIMAFLIYERWVNTDSFWKYYIKALPSDFRSLPIYWSGNDLVLAFNGTSLLHTVMVRKLAINNLLTVLKTPILKEYFGSDTVPTIEQAMWVYSVISTRIFFFPDSQQQTKPTDGCNGCLINTADLHKVPHGPDRTPSSSHGDILGGDRSAAGYTPELCLIPILDMLNHSQDEPVTLNITRQGATLGVGSPIKAGAEVHSNYGSKGNEVFLANYGFVIENNNMDFITVKLKSSGDEFIQDKLEFIKSPEVKASLTHTLFYEPGVTGVDDATIRTMRILCFDGRLFSSVRAKYRLSEISDIFSEPVSAQNEIQSLSTLWTLFADKLRVLTEPRESGRLPTLLDRMVEIYRLGQIKIYAHHFTRIDDAFREFIIKSKVIYDEGMTLSLFLARYSLSVASKEFISGINVIERVASELEEGTESDLIIPMLLLDLKFHSPKKISRFVSEMNCSPLEGNLEEFFEANVKPIVKELPHCFPEQIYTLDSFTWAASVFEANRVVIHNKLLEYSYRKDTKCYNSISINEISNFSSSNCHVPCCLMFNFPIKTRYSLDRALDVSVSIDQREVL